MIQDIDISMIDFTGIEIPENFCMEEIQLTIAGHFKGEESLLDAISQKTLGVGLDQIKNSFIA